MSKTPRPQQQIDRAAELLEEATTYTGSPSWSPSLTEEIENFLLEKAHPAHLCIEPACGPKCCDCNRGISDATMRRYAIRYAYLRDHDPRFGMPTAWLAFQTLDEAIDADIGWEQA